jgi:hypothetical protein
MTDVSYAVPSAPQSLTPPPVAAPKPASSNAPPPVKSIPSGKVKKPQMTAKEKKLRSVCSSIQIVVNDVKLNVPGVDMDRETDQSFTC